MDTYTRLYVDAMNRACMQAVKATSNDVIKWTLPNTPDNTAKNVPASRQRSTYRQNIKALRQRITGDIVGDSVTSAIPSARGNPIPRTIKGDGNMPYMLIDKGKGKRKKKKRKIALRIAKTPQELLEYIKKK